MDATLVLALGAALLLAAALLSFVALKPKRAAGAAAAAASAASERRAAAAARRARRAEAVFTLKEVAEHASEDDCWIVVRMRDGVYKVFDVTDYVDEHPGGEAIMNNAGRDATEGFHGASFSRRRRARARARDGAALEIGARPDPLRAGACALRERNTARATGP